VGTIFTLPHTIDMAVILTALNTLSVPAKAAGLSSPLGIFGLIDTVRSV